MGKRYYKESNKSGLSGFKMSPEQKENESPRLLENLAFAKMLLM
jgi:hypothetical protein